MRLQGMLLGSLILIFSCLDTSAAAIAELPDGEITQVSLASIEGTQVLYLKENADDRFLRVMVGEWEGRMISLALQQLKGNAAPPTNRPLTYRFMANIIDELGGQIERVVVYDFQDTTFHAYVVFSTKDGRKIIDSRPSDAIALALNMGKPVPIYVAKWIMDRLGARGPAPAFK